MSIVLGLDCATKTGWCLWDAAAGKRLESGVVTFTVGRGESPGLRFLRFRTWLYELVRLGTANGLALVAYEQAHHRGGAATELCVGFTTRVQEIAADNRIECATVHTGTLKKWATGSGAAGKPEMMAAAVPHLGRDPIDDNEADAVHIARWAAATYLGGK